MTLQGKVILIDISLDSKTSLVSNSIKITQLY